MAEYQPAPPRPRAPPSNTFNAGPCNYPSPYHGACSLDAPGDMLASAPLSPVECVILGIAGFWLGTVAVIACRLACRSRRREREEDRESLQTLVGTPPRPLILPTLRDKEQDWSASAPTRSNTFITLPNKPGTLRLPALCLRDNGYTRLRDTVPCRTLGGLDQSDAGRLPVQQPMSARTPHDHPSDVQEEAAAQGSPAISDPDSTLSYPEWIRPYLPSFREQAKHEWNVYRPQTGLVAVSSISPSSSSSRAATPFPVIVVQPCNDVPSSRPDSTDSVCSVTEDFSYEDDPSISVSPGLPQYTPCLVFRSRGERGFSREVNASATEDGSLTVAPTNSDMASPVSFYFPNTPTFNESAYLQVPSTSYDSPTEIEGIHDDPRQTQIATSSLENVSGQTAVLQRTRAFKAKVTQDPSTDVGVALASDTSFGRGRGLAIEKPIGLGSSSDLRSGPDSASSSSDTHGVQGDIPLDLHYELTRVDDTSRDSTIHFSDVLGHFHCSVEVPFGDSVYSNSSLVSNSSSDRTSTDDSSDCHLLEIIDLYRRRDTYDETSNLHRVLDGWVNASTGRAKDVGMGPSLPYGPPWSEYASNHSAV